MLYAPISTSVTQRGFIFLDEEVRPYTEMDNNTLEKVLNEYRDNNFQIFQKLNDTIAKAILRAEKTRAALERNLSQLFDSKALVDPSLEKEWEDPDLKRPFAPNIQVLNERIKQQLLGFIAAEKAHFGEEIILKHPSETIAIFEKHMRDHEAGYLFIDESGAPLAASQKENLFTLHILKSLASSLDAHTSFLNPAEAYDMKVRLEKGFEGIGIVLKQLPNGTIEIEHLLPESPAAKNGQIKPGDLLLSVDGQPTLHQSLDAVMDLLRSKDQTVSLVIRHKDSTEIAVELKRALIPVNEDRVDVNAVPLEKGGIIGILTLHSFYQGAGDVTSVNDIQVAIQKLKKQGNLRGLILDLRENSGGFLIQAVKVGGLFITNGVIVISKYSNGEEHFYRDVDSSRTYVGPFVILTSKATASAAEIVAESMQDYGVALIVGDDQTYGKGSIQTQTVTGDQVGSYFKVTVGKYYTPSGKTPQIQGVKADIVVKSPFGLEHIGEEYLDYPLSDDTIPPSFDDTLADVEPSQRPWYLRYYLPTLQHPVATWRQMIPTLKERSAKRLQANAVYQHFLKQGLNMPPPRWTEDDQMHETVNIVKDMIELETKARSEPTTDL